MVRTRITEPADYDGIEIVDDPTKLNGQHAFKNYAIDSRSQSYVRKRKIFHQEDLQNRYFDALNIDWEE